MKLDSTDAVILEVLRADGRSSLREIARQTSLTTPTVSSHLSRMLKGGLIKKFAPVFSPEAIKQGVSAISMIKVPNSKVEVVARKLAKMAEVTAVFVTTGESNMMIRLDLGNSRDLQLFLSDKLRSLHAEVIQTQIISKAVKEEQPEPMVEGLTITLCCDYCKGEVNSNRPYNIKVGSAQYYFCCKTCRKSYLEKYGTRIAKIETS
jgi:DNA-binding Lrp family transcriptional regulator